ncbi:MAG TPA: phosphatase PAP2 family protein [Chloroflexaceae bacterium]|nr:phosphatase PAP2 family protein [Chloroflexaceae bacterium]
MVVGTEEQTAPRAPARRWAGVAALVALWARFRDDARALGRAAWAAWLRALLVGLALCCALSAALTLTGRSAAPGPLETWDQQALVSLLEAPPFTFATAGVLESPGNLFGMWLLILAGTALAIQTRRPVLGATLFSGHLLALAIFWAGWLLWNRARPDLVAGGIAAPGLHSFPSGHMVHVVAMYGYLAALWMRASGRWLERLLIAALFIAFCAAVGLARLILGTHWPSDVLAGTLLGLAWAAVMVYAHLAAERAAGGR